MPGSPRRSARSAAGTALAVLVTALSALVPAEAAAAGDASRAAVAVVDPALASAGSGSVRTVVRAAPGRTAEAEALVAEVGGTLTRRLPLVEGFAATLPAPAVPRLAASGLVRVVSLDRPVTVQGSSAQAETGPASVHLRETGVLAVREDGGTGAGVTVALIDTGVAPVPDLVDRLVPVTDDRTGETHLCHNLSGEPGCADSYGHGTFVAGLIAGNGAASAGRHTGAAPGAGVLSVKVAGRSGASDVSTVLAAIQWVVSFEDRYGIDVLNLSLGTDSTQPWQSDPLNYAVERAWDAGITVVVSAANLGPDPGTVTKPADDPLVITVGAVDDRGTPAVGDDQLPDFSSRGPTQDGLAKPDVVAPGAHLTSLRAPDSLIDASFPADGSYRQGSGTSMSAGLVSGAVAVLLQQRPDLLPDEVKALLRATARPVASDDPLAVGAGLLDLQAAVTAPVRRAAQTAERSSGLGGLDASRGTLDLRVDDPLGTLLTGRQTAQLLLWEPLGFVGVPWTDSTWYTTAHSLAGWNTASFDGHNWGGHNWGGHNWGGSTWYGEHDGTSAYGTPIDGSAWYGAWD